MKDEWDKLKAEINSLEQTHKPSSGDACNHFEISDSVTKNEINEINKDNEVNEDSDNVSNHLSSNNELETSPKPIDYSLVPSATRKLNDDVNKGKQNLFFTMFSSDPVITKRTSYNDVTKVVVDDTYK